MAKSISAIGQVDVFDEIIVDNFAGGGGASTGIELGGRHCRQPRP